MHHLSIAACSFLMSVVFFLAWRTLSKVRGHAESGAPGFCLLLAVALYVCCATYTVSFFGGINLSLSFCVTVVVGVVLLLAHVLMREVFHPVAFAFVRMASAEKVASIVSLVSIIAILIFEWVL
jgi:hypothetical protein